MNDDLNGEIKEYRGAADSAAGHARNVYLTFILFGVYLAIIFGSTTHEQLLRETAVTLPILNVGLPLVGLYWIAPALFVLLHFNLLMQFYLLSGKLHQLDRAIEQMPDRKRRDAQRTLLYPFPFSHMLIGHHHTPLARFLLTMIVWITVLVLPAIVLIFGQIRFLPYHGFWTTWWLRFLVILDLVLLWLLWLRIVDPSGQHASPIGLLSWRPAPRIEFLSRALDLDWWLSKLRQFFDGSWGRKSRDWRVGLMRGLTLMAVSVSLLLVTIPGEFLAGPVDGLVGTVTRTLGEPPADLRLLPRNLHLREKELVLVLPEPLVVDAFGEEQALEKYTRGLDLAGRDLRYADLARADLRRADLRLAQLQGADLREAQLQGANLGGAQLQGANLGGAQLQGADLTLAQLQGADLVRLQGYGLRGAQLQGAKLSSAQLQGADLSGAQFQGADLGSTAKLQGADLSEAQLQGANLGGAQLQGADLSGAQLQGADLGGAQLQGADLSFAGLWRALLDQDARWNLADLRRADAAAIDDIDELIASTAERITDEVRRDRVVARLEAALRGSARSAFPDWQGQPKVMFWTDDQIPQELGWDGPEWATVDEYDQELATFLGNLACGEDTSKEFVTGLARRAILLTPKSLFRQRLAARLTPDDPDACPAATELPEDTRDRLRKLAAEPYSPAPQPSLRWRNRRYRF